MATFRSALNPAMLIGKRAYDPLFALTAKNKERDWALWNTTTRKVYHHLLITDQEEVPSYIHSAYVKRYLRIKQMQRECLKDDGYKIYVKFPVQRAFYRLFCAIIITTWVVNCTGVMWIVYEESFFK